MYVVGGRGNIMTTDDKQSNKSQVLNSDNPALYTDCDTLCTKSSEYCLCGAIAREFYRCINSLSYVRKYGSYGSPLGICEKTDEKVLCKYKYAPKTISLLFI